jgi:hypothetical protein
MGIAVVDVLVQSIPGAEGTIALVAIWHLDVAVVADRKVGARNDVGMMEMVT